MSQRQYIFGKWKSGALTRAAAAGLCLAAARLRRAAAAERLDRVLRVMGDVARRWADPRYGPRRRAEKLLPGATGFSPAMVRRGIRELCWTFNPEFLRRKLATEVPAALDSCGGLSAEPLGVMLHVLAGNVFVGAAGSLAEGLITRNVNILKMSSTETVFLPELLRSLEDCDPEGLIRKRLAVVEYSSGQKDVIAELKKRVDGIVVWGGEEAVRAYRDGLPARTRLIVFGPKLSLAVVTRAGAAEEGLASVAARLAEEISIWDQNACTAPQACYAEGARLARALAEALANQLERLQRRLPAGETGRDQAVEIQKLRSVAAVAEGRGEGMLLESPKALNWTVILDNDRTLEPSPLHRTLRVIPFKKTTEVIEQLESLRGYIQTVGLCAGAQEWTAAAGDLAAAGALRVVALGGMAEGEIDDPHDGRHDLPQFFNLVLKRSQHAEPPAWAAMPERSRRARIDERLRVLIDAARRAPFYARRLKGLRIETAADLPSVPPLTREEMEANMPPQGSGLGTGPWTGGYVTRSGGSTGAPKFSLYDGRDWENMISHAVEVFRCLGLEASDRLANFMMAGDLYGSFVSFDHINERLGLTTFAFAGSSTPEAFVHAWKNFGINAVEGIPSQLLPFLRKAKQLEPGLRLEKLVYAGTPLAPSDYAWLKEACGLRRIASVIGANDGGQIAYQCPAQRGARHHTVDDFNILEIVDERGRPLPDGRVGRILITSLLKFAFPLIRYAVGDQGRRVPGACSCGDTNRVLEYRGRADDMISVGMMNVRYGDFVTALGRWPVSTLQIAARNDQRGEALVVRVESAAKRDHLAQRMRETILKRVVKLRERLDCGDLADLSVEILAPGALPRNPRSGKVKGLVDERR